jgi:glutamate dehydrogenase (NADP+)
VPHYGFQVTDQPVWGYSSGKKMACLWSISLPGFTCKDFTGEFQCHSVKGARAKSSAFRIEGFYLVQEGFSCGKVGIGMRFCQSYMNELYRYIGADVDVPAGDIGVGAREVGFLYGQYKRLTGIYHGVFTGKGLTYGGSLANKTVVVSGSGNVATYAAQKAQELGAHVVAMSDSNGYIYDPKGINLDVIKQIKQVERKRISAYTEQIPSAEYHEGAANIWSIKCDIALPCATQNELDGASAAKLVANGVKVVAEGANMPSTPEAIKTFQDNNVFFGPAKACNAGGVATSALEMSQNSMRLSWSFEEVDAKLKDIMVNIYRATSEAAEAYGLKGNLVAGANIAGFIKVAKAMLAQGVV